MKIRTLYLFTSLQILLCLLSGCSSNELAGDDFFSGYAVDHRYRIDNVILLGSPGILAIEDDGNSFYMRPSAMTRTPFHRETLQLREYELPAEYVGKLEKTGSDFAYSATSDCTFNRRDPDYGPNPFFDEAAAFYAQLLYQSREVRIKMANTRNRLYGYLTFCKIGPAGRERRQFYTHQIIISEQDIEKALNGGHARIRNYPGSATGDFSFKGEKITGPDKYSFLLLLSKGPIPREIFIHAYNTQLHNQVAWSMYKENIASGLPVPKDPPRTHFEETVHKLLASGEIPLYDGRNKPPVLAPRSGIQFNQ